MVEISILVRFSPFFIQVGVFLILVPTIESWLLVPSHGSWISVLSIENLFFWLVPYAFFRVAMWNPISGIDCVFPPLNC
jgi:hypothetical protein